MKRATQSIFYSTAGIAAMAVILIGFNVVSSVMKQRIDLTREKAYTLSDGTRAILKNLQSPVKVRFYLSQVQDATPDSVFLKAYGRRVEDLLAEYKQAARGKLIIEKYDPQPDSDAEDRARLDSVEGETLQNGERFYLGLAVSKLDRTEAIPFLAPNRERQLEYDLSRAISRVVLPEKPVIGVMSALPVFGAPSNPMMMQMGQQGGGQEPWAIIAELKNDFSVERVGMDVDQIDPKIKVLMVIHPREITDKAQFALDQFVLRGGKLIAFLDPVALVDSRQQGQMSIPNAGSSLDKLLNAWGISFDTAKVVADMNFKMPVSGRGGRPQEVPTFLSVTSAGIDQDDIVTSQIDNVWLPFAGAFAGTPAPGLKETVLLKSTPASQLVDGFMANMSSENIIKEFKPSNTAQALAIRLTGKFKTAFPAGKPQENPEAGSTNAPPATTEQALKESQSENTVILVGDSDMLYDNFAIRQMQSPFGNMAMPMNANLNFAQNAVEQMSGDKNLITVRSRAIQNRPFELVKNMQSQAEDRYRNRIKELEGSLAETQRQLNELQQKKDASQRFILSPDQQAAVENFRKKENEVRLQLKEERKKLRHDIDSLESNLKWFNIAALPVLVSITGVTLAFYKRKRTSAK